MKWWGGGGGGWGVDKMPSFEKWWFPTLSFQAESSTVLYFPQIHNTL